MFSGAFLLSSAPSAPRAMTIPGSLAFCPPDRFGQWEAVGGISREGEEKEEFGEKLLRFSFRHFIQRGEAIDPKPHSFLAPPSTDCPAKTPSRRAIYSQRRRHGRAANKTNDN